MSDTENPNLVPTAPFLRTTKEYLVEAAEALYLAKYPKCKAIPAVALAPNGRIVATVEGGDTLWLSELEVKEAHLRITAKAVDNVLIILADKVPHNIRTHTWYKELMEALVDAQAFPELPKP